MQGLRLKVKMRAFPSHGRVRLNAAYLPKLGITGEESVDLINEVSGKTATVIVIADTMVGEEEIRVSKEDLEALGLKDGDTVLVKKTPPLSEKIKKAADYASHGFTDGVGKLETSVRKTAGEVRAGAEKTTGTLKEETKKVSEKVGKVAADTTKKVKKTVEKATGPHDEL
jgi:ribosomal protein L30/L7E